MPQHIRAFLEAYRNAFNDLDGQAVANLYAEPSGIAKDAVYTHWPNRDRTCNSVRRTGLVAFWPCRPHAG